MKFFLKDTLIKCLLSSLLWTVYGNCLSQSNNLKISDTPDWVQVIKSSAGKFDKANNTSGYYYLLTNSQDNLQKKQWYRQCIVKIINNEGVQEMSDIKLDFDPVYQKLLIHSIKVIRDGVVINKLNYGEIKVVQRETNIERHLYDGRKTAIVNLSDIRAGDIIDYSYSIIGENPVLGGMYDNKIYLQYSVPVGHYYYQLIVPTSRLLKIKYFNGARQAKQVSGNDFSYIWEKKDLKSIIYDINTPYWHDPYPFVSISEYASWESVVQQFSKLYSINAQEKEILKNNLEKLKFSQSIDSAIIQSIRFVQDEIRYLGFENGLNSHKPNSPAKVITQRYGDCKAKSFLLSEILKTYGVQAAPVLVNSNSNKSFGEELPSPNLFNHCIVQIERNGTNYYIDPTISNQGGDLEHIYIPDYKKGLVLKGGTTSLVDIPFNNHSSTKSTETYKLQNVGSGTTLNVRTIYVGAMADFQRANFKSEDIEAIQQSYINFYSKLYPGIREASTIRTVDLREGLNEFVVEESYVIDSVWTKSKENQFLLSLEFNPLTLRQYVLDKQSPARTMPYYVEYPVDIEHNSIIELPEKWNIENSSKTIESKSFIYQYNVKYQSDELWISHKYKTLKDHVEANKVGEFVTKHNEIVNNLSYFLTYDTTISNGGYVFSWKALVLVFILLGVCVYFAFRIYWYYDIETYYRPETAEPIGGWLYLLAFGLTLTPFRILYEVYNSPQFFNDTVWDSLLNINSGSYNVSLAIIMLFELIYNVVYFVLSGLCVLLFYKRRTIFPKFGIILYALGFIVIVVDAVACINFNSVAYTDIQKDEFFKDIAKAFVAACVWIPYLLASMRVRKTFVFKSESNLNKPGEHVEVYSNHEEVIKQ